MVTKQIFRTVLILLLCTGSLKGMPLLSSLAGQTEARAMDLPKVESEETGSLTDLFYQRSSVRRYSQGTLSLEQISKILFAAQGITRSGRFRTVPSAGALYPLEVYLAVGKVQGLQTGVYKYRPNGHGLNRVVLGDKRMDLAREAYGQRWIAEAQAVVVICSVYERVTGKYGERGRRYVHIEAGCAAQNISLAGFNNGLGSTVVGAFNDEGLARVIKAEHREKPIIVMPVGLLP